MAFLKIETELTSGILKKKRKDPKKHKRSERTLFTQTKQDRMRIFEKSSFSKLRTNKQTIHLSFASWILAEGKEHEILMVECDCINTMYAIFSYVREVSEIPLC